MLSMLTERFSTWRRKRVRSLHWAVVWGLWIGVGVELQCLGDDAVRFNRDVRPILSDTCFRCHGPDSLTREADLRLDQRDGLYADRDGEAIVSESGQLVRSLLWQRISSSDPDVQMPPPDSRNQLSEEQRLTLRKWLEQGAPWEDHWSFVAPERPATPQVSNPQWVRNPIDEFVLAELDRRGWQPSPTATPETLVRRLTLDLTGLPPTPVDVDRYLADTRPDRYQRLVDRLLASSRYGEHMAVAWLDAARFADTSGYQNDGPRDMWRWRDWVIEAYNADQPFDQFTIEQLAGDLLPDATLEQRLATGFHRNHRGNSEGGIIPEEYAVEYVVDRVDTTGTVWLGLTIGCARCHAHKFDPISQHEYYRLFAFFNNVPEYGRAIKEGNSPPYVKTPTRDQRQQLRRLNDQLQQAATGWKLLSDEVALRQQDWESKLRDQPSAEDWTITTGLVARLPLDKDLHQTVEAPEAAGDRQDASAADANAAGRPRLVGPQASFSEGRHAGLELNGETFVDAGDLGRFTYLDAFSVSAWVRPAGTPRGGIVSRMSDDSYADGWAFHVEDGHLQVNLVKRWLDDSLRVQSTTHLQPDQWQHVCMTYDGSRLASGIEIYINGVSQPKQVNLDGLNQSFENDQPLRIGSTGSQSRFVGTLSDVRVYGRSLEPVEVEILATEQTLSEIARRPPDSRTPGMQRKLRHAFLSSAAPDSIRSSRERMRELEADRDDLLAAIPTTMVMDQRDMRRPTHVLDRGAYDRPRDAVTPGVPQVLVGDREIEGDDRLALARWIVSSDNPLTPRVVANREWQRFFGQGLVRTGEDFGTQGDRPSHPELLDWLATELVHRGWGLKQFHRLLVTSATYRQSSDVTPALVAADPENRWLARGPRFRLSAEAIRDQALAVSGLLSEQQGGPSVFPYQPEGLWSEIATTTNYQRSTGADLYRRSLYSYWKRTVTNPTLGAFDVPSREVCVVQRPRTNTPLQALTLLNDVTFVEASRKLAEQTLSKEGASHPQRLKWMFRRVTGRRPQTSELKVLRHGFEWHLQRFRGNPDAAKELLQVGDSTVSAELPAEELAAFTSMASVILNLDEVVNRN